MGDKVCYMTLNSSEAVGLSLREALALPRVARQSPYLMTSGASLDRTVRWVHIVDQERPARFLQGRELVLSTLPHMFEGRPDLEEVLRTYLDELDLMGASALAVEVPDNRPNLLHALNALATERNSHPSSAELVPLFIFPHVVKFIDITEAVHRKLVTLQTDGRRATAPAWDPVVIATTNLLRDLAAPGGLPDEEVQERAVALGASREVAYFFLSVHLMGTDSDVSENHLAILASTIRETAAKNRVPALVGATGQRALGILLPAQQRAQHPRVPQTAVWLCTKLRDSVAQLRYRSPVPQYVIGSSEQLAPLTRIWPAVQEATAIAHSAALVTRAAAEQPSGQKSTPHAGYWTADDLNLNGVLVHLKDTSRTEWFLRRYLDPLKEAEVPDARGVVRAAIHAGGNKAQMARSLGVSRPTLYSRIEHLERALQVPLEGESLALLYVALQLEPLTRPPL